LVEVERARFEKFDLGVFDRTGDSRFSIVLDNDTIWTPPWDKLILSFKYALRTEARNEGGDAQRNLVEPILAILNKSGYKVTQHLTRKAVRHGFLYECEVKVKISDSMESTSTVYVTASDRFDAIQDAIHQVQDELVTRVRNTSLNDKLMRVVSARTRVYRSIGGWEDYWIDDTEAGF
jgi:hypothetical protein